MVPLSIAYQRPPQPAFYSQATALAAWAMVTLLAALIGLQERNNRRAHVTTASVIVLLVWAALLVVALAHAATGLSPAFIVAPTAVAFAVALGASAVVLLIGGDASRRRRALAAVMLGLIVAALVNAFAAGVQMIAPGFADDMWVASLNAPGERAGGNLRQPNQLATLMIWGMLAATWLTWRYKVVWMLLCATMLATLLASGSRTGVLSLALITGAALLHSGAVRRMRLRGWIALLLVFALVGWLAVDTVFSRATAGAALSQRLTLWRDVLVLIGHAPWCGVGIGQLNFAWTLTPLPARAPDVFDHAHSLPLHLAAELGGPLALLIVAAVAFALTLSRAALRSRAGATVGLLLATMLLHSLFEYPLWFGYFLLPTAFLLAWFASDSSAGATRATENGPAMQRPVRPKSIVTASAFCALGAMLAVGAVVYATGEYGKAAAIHARSPSRAALDQTVATARGSALYGHYGDYAAIMLAGDAASLSWFARPIRHVLDERLLAAYALALAREGDDERARFVAARAQEFPPHWLFERLRSVAPPAAASTPGASGVPITISGPEHFSRPVKR